MSIRLRLTLWYSAVLALTLIAFSLVLYFVLSRATYDLLRSTLEDEAQRLTSTSRFQLDRIVSPAGKFPAPEIFAQTRDLNGRLLDQTPNLSSFGTELPISETTLQQARYGHADTHVETLRDRKYLIYTRPVVIRGLGQVGIIQTARSINEEQESLRTLQTILIIGTGVVTIIAFGVGWVLAGIALRPIDRITQTAQAIGTERDFGRRVDHRGPLDEVGRLATTFNSMLAALQSAYRQEAQALQAQRRFVADASHELRTPLTTIRGNLGLLQREPPISRTDRVAVLADMVDESERMSRLVNDLLVLARADSGRPLRKEPVAIKPLIEDICRKAKALDPEQSFDCADQPDVYVEGDEDALKQVLLILLDNAFKFTPAHGTINVTTTLADNHVQISVQDTGSGIPADALPHVFERFYRGDVSRTGGGAGLGLSIAKTLVEAQHGTIAVHSVVDQGSTFTVTLPQATALSQADPQPIHADVVA